MKNVLAALVVVLLGLSAPVAQAQAVPPAPGGVAGSLAGTGVTVGAAAALGLLLLVAVFAGDDDDAASSSSSSSSSTN